jgi:hypothetical protein
MEKCRKVRPGFAEDAFFVVQGLRQAGVSLWVFRAPAKAEGVFVLGRGLPGPECFPFLLFLLLRLLGPISPY